jgi:hypothetical protein
MFYLQKHYLKHNKNSSSSNSSGNSSGRAVAVAAAAAAQVQLQHFAQSLFMSKACTNNTNHKCCASGLLVQRY